MLRKNVPFDFYSNSFSPEIITRCGSYSGKFHGETKIHIELAFPFCFLNMSERICLKNIFGSSV